MTPMSSKSSARHAGARRGLATAIAALLLELIAGSSAIAEPVVVGGLGIVADAPFFIGIEKGYFAAEKIEIRVERFRSAADMTAPLSTGQIQVAGGGLSAGLFNAFERGWPVRIAMARSRDTPGFSSDILLVREDLRHTIKSLGDLKGRTIAVNAPFGALHYMMGRVLESANLSIRDVNIVFMGWPDMGPAFDNKAIDAGAVTEPFGVRYTERKLAYPFLRAADILKQPALEVAVILYSKAWIDASPDQVRAFTVAYLKGVRDYYDAMRGGPSRSWVVPILMKHTSLKDEALYQRIQWSYMDPNAELLTASLDEQQDWYVKNGAMKKKLDTAKMIDSRFIEYAVGRLGRVAVK